MPVLAGVEWVLGVWVLTIVALTGVWSVAKAKTIPHH